MAENRQNSSKNLKKFTYGVVFATTPQIKTLYTPLDKSMFLRMINLTQPLLEKQICL